MLVHNTIRKYTLAMLETFNGLKVEYKIENTNGTPEYKYKNIPIKYSTREKINQLDETEEQNLLSGNHTVLPRTSLALLTVIKNNERQSNKFNKIATTDFGNFIFNAVAYDFSYEMSIMCRGMNEASSVAEQIASRFNPTYTLLVNEIPDQITPTSVVIQLSDIAIEGDTYDEFSTDIIIVTASMILKGNFYSPVQNMEKIKNVDMYLNFWYHSTKNDYNRAKLFKYDVTDNILEPNPLEINLISDDGTYDNILPVITDIICVGGNIGDEIPATVVYTDYDNKYNELEFIWSITGDSEIIGSGDSIFIKGNSTETLELKCKILDVNNNTSNIFIKQVQIV